MISRVRVWGQDTTAPHATTSGGVRVMVRVRIRIRIRFGSGLRLGFGVLNVGDPRSITSGEWL